jgi:hypothetical protein
MTQEEKTAALDRLQRLMRARDGKAGYAQNIEAIKAQIELLKAQPVSE